MISEYIGKSLKEINYNKVLQPYLSIFKDDKEVAFGFKGEVLKLIPDLADNIVKESNIYFEALVLRV